MKCWDGLSPHEQTGVCQTENYVEGNSVWTYIYILIGLSCVLMIELSKYWFKYSYRDLHEKPV